MSDRPKIILHIGAGKTGSSAIQSFLDLNVDALRREGIVVPANDFGISGRSYGNHVRVFREWNDDPVAGRQALESAIANLVEHAGNASTLLISAENLAAYKAGPDLFEGLTKNHEIEVILYIRRQDEFILSAWQQWNAKVQDDFLAWLLTVVGTHGNWHVYLTSWEKVIPRKNIKVRIFDRTQLKGGDVIADFYDQLGLSVPFDSFAYPAKEANPSFPESIMEMVKGNRRIFRDAHDNRFQEFVHDVTDDRYVKNRRESLLTAAQRRAIVARYASGNRWVQKIYFGEKKGGLFAPVRDDAYFLPDPKTMLRQQLGFLVAIVFGVYRWRRERRQKNLRENPDQCPGTHDAPEDLCSYRSAQDRHIFFAALSL